MLQRENVGHSAAAGSRWGVITVSPAEFVFIHRIKWEGKKPDLYKEKKNHWVGWGNIVERLLLKYLTMSRVRFSNDISKRTFIPRIVCGQPP